MKKIRIFNEEDRLKVAAVLVRNGYRVCQGKEKRSPSSKSYDYFLEFEDVRDKQEESK